MKEQKIKYSRVHKILDGTLFDIKEVPGSRLSFPLYQTREFIDKKIEELDLDVRSYNCLKRCGIHTMGDFISRIRSSSDLKKIRNCGSNSAANIMDAIFAFQYEILDEKGKMKFLEDILRMNSTT